jgi:hypothetical protein
MSRIKEAAAAKLSAPQRRVINNDDVAWVGWDAKDRPVVGAWYYAGILQPPERDRRNAASEWREWAMLKNGDPTDVSTPVVRL